MEGGESLPPCRRRAEGGGGYRGRGRWRGPQPVLTRGGSATPPKLSEKGAVR